jgi:preprotein translocase subunit SecA
MKQFLIFIGGMVAGALLLYAIGFRKESSVREQLGQELIETLSHNLKNQKAEVQYIEVKGKKGNVTLHTGMTKDSVRIFLGKPDNVELRSYGNALEDWGYKIRNNYVPDLEINFEAGKLKSLRQN